MQQIQEIKQKLSSTRDMHSVVKTMKSMAAVNIHHYEEAVTALDEYSSTVSKALQIVISKLPELTRLPAFEHGGGTGCIILGSKQGMVGQFNEHLAENVYKTLSSIMKGPLFHENLKIVTLGYKMESIIGQHGLEVENNFAIEETIEDVTPLLNSLLDVVQSWRFQENISSIIVFYNQEAGKAAFESETFYLYPLEEAALQPLGFQEWDGPSIPQVFIEPEKAFRRLVQEYLFIMLYRAVMHSLASENAARLRTMENAQQNIEDRLDELTDTYNQRRQLNITSELLDIITGFEALKED
ncbi:MAG: F0F1 ATP synthase subunit gamma [Spirochaetia bacterium]